jgi:ammonia channel protein AmtB
VQPFDFGGKAGNLRSVGGFVGTILLAVFGSQSFAGGLGSFSIGEQLVTQSLASLYTIILSGIVSYVILLIIDKTIGLRVNESQVHRLADFQRTVACVDFDPDVLLHPRKLQIGQDGVA